MIMKIHKKLNLVIQRIGIKIMTYSLNNANKCDVTAIEVIYKGGKRRIFSLKNKVYRYDALDLQTKLENYDNVFRVNCHTTLNNCF